MPVTVYYADHAWLGDAVARPAGEVQVGSRSDGAAGGRTADDAAAAAGGTVSGVVIEVDGRRITAVRHGVPRAAPGSGPPARGDRLRARQRPLARLPSRPARADARRAAARSGRGASRCTPGGRARPPSITPLARAVYAEMALSGIPPWGEFHYLHHAPGGQPYGTRTRWRTPCVAPPPDAGPADHAARHLLPRGRDRAAARGGAAPLRRRHRRGPGRAGSADLAPPARSHRRGRPLGPRRARRLTARSSWRARRTDGRCTSHLSEQPAENEACLAAYGCTPTQLLAEHGVLSARGPPRCTPPTSPTTTSPARRQPYGVLLLPDDRARPRRRHRAGAAARGRRVAAVARQRPARGRRPVRGGPRPGGDERLSSLQRGRFDPPS